MFNLSSANAFNLVTSKILSFGKGLSLLYSEHDSWCSKPCFCHKRLTDCMVLNAIFDNISVKLRQPVYLSMLS